MGYQVSARSSIYLVLSPHFKVNGHSPYDELKKGCWAMFHKQGTHLWETPHLRLSTHRKNANGFEDFTGSQVRAGMTPDNLARWQFARKTKELRSMPVFGMSLSDILPTWVGPGVWIFPLPIIRRD